MNKIFVYVQHLLGIGHLQRTALITSILAEDGFDVTVVSGGMPDPLVDFGKSNFIQLPAVKTDPEFSDLFDERGNPITEKLRKVRIEKLVEALHKVTPDLVLIETYPFGRRQMRFELLPLLQAIKHKQSPRAIVACSIRDVIQPKFRAKRVQEIQDLVNQYFDFIFIHGDQNFIEFERTFPRAKSFKDKLVYTGYVTKPRPDTSNITRDAKSVLVSAGGGAVGKKLYQTAIHSSRQLTGREYNWHIVVGSNYSEGEFHELQKSQAENLIIERNRSDFVQLLCRCSVSVSQGGYNTMMDMLMTNTPSIIIPFEGQAEQEQLIRALAFEAKKLGKVLREKNLTESTLLSHIVDSEIRDFSPSPSIKIEGSQRLAKFIRKIKSQKQPLNNGK